MKYSIHIKSAGAPATPTSRGTTAGRLVFASGVLPTRPDDEESLVEGGAAEQAERIIDQIELVLDEVGCTLADVAQATVYLSSLSLIEEVDAVYERRFGAPWPTRSVVGVNELPLGALVQMDVIACR